MKKTLTISTIISILLSVLMVSGCDKINRAERTFDTMLGGDYSVEIIGTDKIYYVYNDKVTSEPSKGYYIFYPTIDGKKRLIQTPINMSIVSKLD